MTNAQYLQTLQDIGWLDNIAHAVMYDSLADAKATIADFFADTAERAGALSLTEAAFDETNLYELTWILDDMLRLSAGDLHAIDVQVLHERGRYECAQDLFDDVNAILQDKGIDKAFYILPRIDDMVFYVYKPIAVFEQALSAGLIDYTVKPKTYDTDIAVLFDLDGTLIDTAPDFIRIIRSMCARHDHACPSDTAIREQVSAGARAMVRLMFGDRLGDVADTDAQLLAYRQEFLDLYEADICVDSRLFDGLDNFLADLENGDIRWGIVTNKPRYLAEQLLVKLALTERCSVLVCPDDVTHTKPDPEPMYLAADRLGINPRRCIYVGDHVRDIQAGQAAGMVTIAAGYGYITPDDAPIDTWGADDVVADVAGLTSCLYGWLDKIESRY